MKNSNLFNHSLVVSSRGVSPRNILEGQHVDHNEYLRNYIETELWNEIEVYTLEGQPKIWSQALIPQRRGNLSYVYSRVMAVKVREVVQVYIASLSKDGTAQSSCLFLGMNEPCVGHDRWTKNAIEKYQLNELLQKVEESAHKRRNMCVTEGPRAKPEMRPKEFAEGLRELFRISRVPWIPLDFTVLKGTFYSERLSYGKKRAAIRFLESQGVAVNQYACTDHPSLWVFYLKDETPPFVDELNERPAHGLDLYAEHQRHSKMAS